MLTTKNRAMKTSVVNVCPIEGCRILGGSLFQKVIRNGKSGKALKYYYFEHRVNGGKSVSHYIGKTKPRIQKARAEMRLISK